MVPFMFVMSLTTHTHTETDLNQLCCYTSADQDLRDSLFTHGAALLGGGFVREGRQTGRGAEEVCGTFTLVGGLAFLQRLLTVSTGHLGVIKHIQCFQQTKPDGENT